MQDYHLAVGAKNFHGYASDLRNHYARCDILLEHDANACGFERWLDACSNWNLLGCGGID